MTGGEGGASERGVSFFLLKSEGLKSPGAERSKDQRGVWGRREEMLRKETLRRLEKEKSFLVSR